MSSGTCTYTEVKIGTPKSAELRTTKPRGGVHAHHEALLSQQMASQVGDYHPKFEGVKVVSAVVMPPQAHRELQGKQNKTKQNKTAGCPGPGRQLQHFCICICVLNIPLRNLFYESGLAEFHSSSPLAGRISQPAASLSSLRLQPKQERGRLPRDCNETGNLRSRTPRNRVTQATQT